MAGKYPRKKFVKKRRFTPIRRKTKTFKKRVFKKRGTLQGRPRRTGTGHWLHVMSFGKKAKKAGFIGKLEGVLAPQINVVNDTIQLSPTPGKQVFSSTLMFNPYDIKNLCGTDIGAPAKNTRFILSSCQMKIYGTNMTNTPLFLDMYTVKYRRDSFTQQTIHALFSAGLAQYPAPIAAGSLSLTPFHSELFTTIVKVLKVTRFNVNPGETIETIVNHRLNKLWHHEVEFNQNAAVALVKDTDGYRNMTLGVLFVCWGPATNDSVTKTAITSGQGTFDLMVSKVYKATGLMEHQTAICATGSLFGTSFAVSEDVMNVDTGAVTTEAVA